MTIDERLERLVRDSEALSRDVEELHARVFGRSRALPPRPRVTFEGDGKMIENGGRMAL